MKNATSDVFKSGRARLPISMAAIVCFLVLGVAYLNPDEFVRSPNLAQRTVLKSVVAYIEQLTVFPVWGILFMVCGLVLAWALFFKREYLGLGHLIGSSVMAGYTASAIATSWINPGTYIVNTVFSLFMFLTNFALLFSYSGRLGNDDSHEAGWVPKLSDYDDDKDQT